MKLLIILAAPFLMDSADPGIVDAGVHGVSDGVEKTGNICASVENGNHNCGDGVHDSMYIQKKGRSIVSSHGHVNKNVQPVADSETCKNIECADTHLPDPSAEDLSCFGPVCDNTGPDNDLCCNPRAACITIICVFPLVTDHYKEALLCKGEQCDDTGPDNEQCCKHIASPDDDTFITAESGDDSTNDETKSELDVAFRQFDLDNNYELDLNELYHGLFSNAAVEDADSPSMNVSASSLGASRDEIVQFVLNNTGRTFSSEDTMTLTYSEFLATSLPEETDAEPSVALVQTEGFAKCLGSINVAETVKKSVDKNVKSCFSSWKIWEWITKCAWSVVKTIVNVVVNTVKAIAASFSQCFSNIIAEIGNGLASAAKSFISLIPKNCYSPSSCLNALKGAINSIMSKIGDFCFSIFERLIGDLKEGIDYVAKLLLQLPPLVEQIGKIVIDVAKALVEFFKNSLNSIRKIMDQISMCTPDGLGWTSFTFTDCGIGATFELLWNNMKSLKLGDVPSNFVSVVGKFAACLVRSELLYLPTPFLSVKVDPFCLPTFLQIPVKSVVGAFVYFVNQLAAAARGCAGTSAEEPLCKLVSDIGSIGTKMQTAFQNRLSLAQTAADITQQLNGSERSGTKVYREDCSGLDFKIFINAAFGVSIPVVGDFSIGFEIFGGCGGSSPYIDLAMTIGYAKGFTIAGVPDVAAFGMSVSFGLGFDIAERELDLQDVAIFAKLSGNLDLKWFGIPFGAGAEIGLKILPELAIPRGFQIAVSVDVGSLSLVQRQIEEAAYHANSPEEKMGSAMGSALSGLAGSDIDAIVAENHPSPRDSLRSGAQTMREVGADKANKIDLLVTMDFAFCLTCQLWVQNGAPTKVANPTKPTIDFPEVKNQYYKTNPDQSANYKKCENPNDLPVKSELGCKNFAKTIGGTWQSSGAHGHWPPGCFRYSGVGGKNVYLGTNPAGTGHAGHVMICSPGPDQYYRTNADAKAVYKKCDDPNRMPVTSEIECKKFATSIGGTWQASGAHGHWPPGCFRYSGVWGMNVYLGTNPAGTGHAGHVMICSPAYVETAYGSANCPTSYKSITDESTCKEAQSSLGKSWSSTSSWGHIQGGCFSHSNNNVWYNTNAGGSTHGSFSSICQKAPNHIGVQQADNSHCYGKDGSTRTNIGTRNTLEECAATAAGLSSCGTAFVYHYGNKWCGCGKAGTANSDCRDSVDANQAGTVYYIKF